MLTAILTAAVLRGSKVAAIAGTCLGNPFTTLPLTALNFHVGQTLLGRTWTALPENIHTLEGFIELGGAAIGAYLLGCLVMGILAGLVGYLLAIPVVAFLQKRANKRRSKRLMR